MNLRLTKKGNHQMKRIIFTTIFIFAIIVSSFAQVGIGTTTPNTSSVLDLTSTNKALLPPRMTTAQRDAIANPVAGMVIYNITTDCIENYTGTTWANFCSVILPPFTGTVTAFAPVAVTKTSTQRVFAHLVPWFETPTSNTLNPGQWGSHWTMATQNPNTFNASGQRNIAAHYYPLTGPYASSDTTIIDYELLLMKLSGIDGVLIDWPGTSTNFDLPMNERNANALIARIAKVGLTYAMVYEDYPLSYAGSEANQVTQGQKDMTYAQTNYFSSSSYEKVNGQPLLLVFGPNQIKSVADWTSIFSVLSTKPTFISYMFNTAAGANAAGQFAWVESSGTTRLNQFYSTNPGVKITGAYPGFNSFYALGGAPWNSSSNPMWVIAANGTSTFKATVSLALQQSDSHYLQIPTWNDYGEGTMIEPTDSTTGGFGFSLLTTLQQQLGVSSLTQTDLEAVLQLYKLRQTDASNPTALAELDQVYYYMVSLQMDKAKALLATL
jgi:hypothetical protein